MPLTKEELLDLFNDFINEQGLWNDFISFIEEKGYTESEVNEILPN